MDPLARLTRALVEAIGVVGELLHAAAIVDSAQLNLAVTDGDVAVVSRLSTGAARPNSLYYISGKSYVDAEGQLRMSGKDGPAAIVASEPLTENPGWTAVPVNHLVCVSRKHDVALVDLDSVSGSRAG